MNILFLFHHIINRNNGGVQRVTSLLGEELRRRGHHVYYLGTRGNGDSKEQHQLGIAGFEKDRKAYLEKYNRIINDYNIEVVINQQLTEETEFLLNESPKNLLKISCIHTQPFAYLGKEKGYKKKDPPY